MSARASISASASSLEDIQVLYGSPATPPRRPSASTVSGRSKRQSLAQIAVPSFSAFRDRASSIPVPLPPKRKAWSNDTSSPPYDASTASTRTRPYSVDSPLPPQPTGLANLLTPPLTAEQGEVADVLHAQRHSHYSSIPFAAHSRAVSIDSRTHTSSHAQAHAQAQAHAHAHAHSDAHVREYALPHAHSHAYSQSLAGPGPAAPRPSSIPVPLRYDKNGTGHAHAHVHAHVASFTSAHKPTSSSSYAGSPRSSMMSVHSPVQPPAMTVHLDGHDHLPRSFTEESFDSTTSSHAHRKSSTSKFTSLFAWKSSSRRASGSHSPTTTFSDRSPSLGGGLSPSQSNNQLDAGQSMALTPPPPLDIHPGTTSLQAQYFDIPGTPLLSRSPSVNAHVEELERELRQVSSELAGSIRREMELEDEVERYRAEMAELPPVSHDNANRRTSDYFSDSGTSSSLRFPLGDSEARIEELEKSRRKVEQEKGQLQVDYAQRLADELKARKDLEAQVHSLEEQIHQHQQPQELAPDELADKEGRVRELELFLDEARRRLSQERESKDNFEDLFAALKEESETNRNERDNLRDEVIPQLQARLEGLESGATDLESLRYDHTRMQQEIATLREENNELKEELNNRVSSHFKSIAEDDTVLPRWPRAGLSRSNSLARSSSHGNIKRGSSVPRSGSVMERSGESRNRSDSISGERIQDIEAQRDALHKALKSLLSRFECQQREHSKVMRKMAADRDRARSVIPGRTAYTREVNNLREEISMLRRRADDALEHKWQAENNIGGVKMALERAEQETRTLREYLSGRRAMRSSQSSQASSSYDGLGISMPEENTENTEFGQEERRAMIKVLRQSIQIAETERDAALREAEAYRERARSLQESASETADEELAQQLLAAANRMEELAAQVQQHLQMNLALRERLSEAVAKGELQQSESTERITQMQSRLKTMEDSVMAAQQQSESRLGYHEEEAKQIDEANSPQLSRRAHGMTASQTNSPVIGGGLFQIRSPRITQTKTGPAESLFEVTKTAVLERRVRDLEAALADADAEMKEVVERINTSQYEIAELQGERDEAQRGMRRLQAQISEEKQKAQALLV